MRELQEEAARVAAAAEKHRQDLQEELEVKDGQVRLLQLSLADHSGTAAEVRAGQHGVEGCMCGKGDTRVGVPSNRALLACWLCRQV